MRMPNRRQQIRLTPEEQQELFRGQRKAALATIGADGFPHLVAMNYFEKDGAFWMTSYGKAQKVVNIRRDPRVALMVELGESYGELRGVMVRGHCTILEEPEEVRAAFAGMAAARPTRQPRPAGAAASVAKRVVLKVTPEKMTSWDHRKLGGRY
jgi:PPOX class probable F420-dependent enzyme